VRKGMWDIDHEDGKYDWARAMIDVRGVGGWVVDRLAELELPVTPYNGGDVRSTKSGSSMLERGTTGHCVNGWSRARSTSIQMTTGSPLSSDRLSGASTHADGSRSNQRDNMRKRGCRRRIARTVQP
jgi:hypothetical protein